MLVPPLGSHVELVWDLPFRAGLNRALTESSRLILFDKRGTGLSDPVPTPATLEERMDDIRAVLDAVGSPEAGLFAIGDGCGARIASLGRAGEVLVSSTVRDLVAGSGIEFSDRGVHELKGLPESRQVFAVVAA